MAANKKSANTSKTAHVMNLISKNNKEPVPEEAAVEVKSAGAAGTLEPASSSAPPVIASLSSDAAVSDQIKNALEDVLEAESPAAPKPGPASVQESAAKAAPVQELTLGSEPEAPAQAAAPAPAPETKAQPPEPQSAAQPGSAPAPVPEPEAVSAPAAAPVPSPEPVQEEKSNHDDLTYVNVMQELVEEKAMKYIKMFGMCQCERCVIDVKATALNNLTPKYVVMKKGEMIPRITLYEGRFNTTVTAQLLNACKLVMDNPRH